MDLELVNLSALSDAEVAAHMRRLNYEKFKTLVRMHLSFELELNTDEFDLPCHEIVYEDKGKIKKWNRLSKKYKLGLSSSATTGCATVTKGSVSAENSPVESLRQQINAGFLFHLDELKNFLLLEKNLNQEGIFRKTGSISRQNELRQQIQHDKPLYLETCGFSAHDCATVFKGYLSDLPEPLLTDAHYPAHLQIAPLCLGFTSMVKSGFSTNANGSLRPINPGRIKREQHLLSSVQLLLLLLPDENRRLLEHIIELLHAVAMREIVNKMSPENLATIFAPHLICPRNLPPEALHYVSRKMSSIIAYMVCKGLEIFEMPAKLSTDIRAYFHERKRKKTMSPEQTLDESISDISTVNTIYSFVDREKTAAAHTANTTDTELAQLYAHIQSLPESSKKRRLIKQFNKQNGQGTPLQLVVMNRLKSSHTDATRSAKSFGDSIKKHIFHKGIMSRTPKRTVVSTATPTAASTGTPNCSNIKNHKIRALFRSPATCHSSAGVSSTVGGTTPLHNTSTPCLPKTNYSSTTNITHSINIKDQHSLHKSTSATSLLSNSSASVRNKTSHAFDEFESCSGFSASSDSMTHAPNITRSISAPVSRQISNESNISLTAASNLAIDDSHDLSLFDSNCCVTPLKIITEAAKQFVSHTDTGGGERKTVAWNETRLLNIEEISNPCTPIQHNCNELKSRYKSEPNLTCSTTATVAPPREVAAKYSNGSRSLTRKLIKGVSMNNLRFPFSTPESTKRLVRSVSSTLRRRSSDNPQLENTPLCTTTEEKEGFLSHLTNSGTGSSEDLDDETFEDNPDDQLDSDSNVDDAHNGTEENFENTEKERSLTGSNTGGRLHAKSNNHNSNSNEEFSSSSGAILYQQMLLQQSGVYRNIELTANTPSFLMGRRSMSPITKSTQRMPKAMQESIMTPRSRKPVMVLTAPASSSSDQNQTMCKAACSNFREQDEDEWSMRSAEESDMIMPKNQYVSSPHFQFEDATSVDSYIDMLQQRHQTTESANNCTMKSPNPHTIIYKNINKCNTLSNNFKEYLLSRSVLTASPVDSSFSSQPDDFRSPCEIDLNDSQMSPSLLYCLDGNQPDENDEALPPGETIDKTATALCTIREYNNTSDVEACHVDRGTNNIYGTRITCNDQQLQNAYFLQTNNARKRAATNDLEKALLLPLDPTKAKTIDDSSTTAIAATNRNISKLQANKENIERVEGYMRSRKLLISEYPGETSL